ncbi:vacuolar ATPase assembly integral membrane protein vma21 [Emmonsiellopsis sp. PD_33]|nr:vacuolar ATPase assembly integral membrane protein vma21 [Emmonsiellopsis sp. PD_33]
MATRRTPSAKEQTLSATPEPEKRTPLPPVQREANSAPAVPSDVLLKLLLFTAAMICAPLGVYFSSVNMLFKGNSTYAGASAALTANLVLIGYVVVAMREDREDREAEERRRKGVVVVGEGKKGQ